MEATIKLIQGQIQIKEAEEHGERGNKTAE